MESSFNLIKRTKEIITQYDSFKLPPQKNYDVTLLLNCCIGLLVVVYEKQNDACFLKTNMLPLSDWHIDEGNITIIKTRNMNDQIINLDNVCKHLRNSIVHCHFKALSHKGQLIDSLVFDDYSDNNEIPEHQTFHYTTSVDDFKAFLEKLSSEASEIIAF